MIDGAVGLKVKVDPTAVLNHPSIRREADFTLCIR